MMRMETYNKIPMEEAWMKDPNPLYIGSFIEIVNTMDRVEKILLNEEELITYVPLIDF